MSASTITAFALVPEGSELTPGFFNSRLQTLQDNIVSINSVVPGPGLLSGSTWASLGLFANSSNSDYIRFVDSSAARSTYRLGSNAGGTADGLNIYDESGSTMIVSFSKQSVRFFQNIVGPVFDTGGALTGTVNAGTYGIGSQSTETRIQAAINDAGNRGIARVYIPATMYPYDASVISFIYTVQMIREGGDAGLYDVRAYGANPNGVTSATAAFVSAASSVGVSGQIWVSGGTYAIPASFTLTSGSAWAKTAVIKPASGATITIAQPVVAPRSQIFDITAGGFIADMTLTPVLYPEWWGASGVTSSALSDDLHAVSNGSAIRSAATILNGNVLELALQYVIDAPIPFPNTSFTLRGLSQTISGVRARRSTPSITLLDFTSCNGPGKFVRDMTLINPQNGVTGGTAAECLNANGIRFQNVWFGGMTIGLRANGSFIAATDCTAEFCTTAVKFDGVALPEESLHEGWVFYQNTYDVWTQVDMTGCTFLNTVHTNTITDCFHIGAGTVNLIAANITVGTGCSGADVINLNGAGVTACHFINVKAKTGKSIALFASCDACTVDGLDVAGGTNGINIANGVTNNKVRGAMIRGASTGIRLTAPGVGNAIEHFDVKSCTTGLVIAAGGFSDQVVALKHGLFASNTTNFDLQSAVNHFEAFDVRADSYGAFKSNADLVANLITAVSYNDLGDRKVTTMAKTPTAAPWKVGDLLWNNAPALSGWAGQLNTVAGTPGTWQQFGHIDVDADRPSYSSVGVGSGTALGPTIVYTSEASLGLYRSGASTIAPSYGTLNLATNAVRLSMRTLAASSVTASAANTNVATNEVVFTIGGTSGASLCISSGGTTYIFNSAISAKNT